MRLLAGVLTIGLVSMSASMAAKEIGTAVQVVQPEVQGALPGKPSERIRPNDAIERGLKVQLTGSAAYLKVAFNLGGDDCVLKGTQTRRFTGTARLQGTSDVSFGDLATPSLPRIGLLLGKLWLAQRSETGCPVEVPLEVDTPHAVVPVKGTYLRIFVDPAVGTFVAVDEGTVSVQAKVGGAPVEVTAGNWVLVPPGRLPTRPAPLPPRDDDEILLDPPLLGCCDGTEPPKALPPQ